MEKLCRTCGKPLPPEYNGDQCSLCRVGLAPVRSVAAVQNTRDYEGRVLTGMYCPSCSAELSIADLSQGRCAICNSVVSANTAVSTPHPPQAGDYHGLKHTNQVGQKVWPEDAPLW